MFLIDLKDAYFQITVHPDFQPYFSIALGGKVCQFIAVCFSLSTASQIFTIVFARVSEWADKKGVQLLHYLDNLLVIAESVPLMLQHQEQLLQLCMIINQEKSDLKPSSMAQYLKMLIDTTRERVFLTNTYFIKSN